MNLFRVGISHICKKVTTGAVCLSLTMPNVLMAFDAYHDDVIDSCQQYAKSLFPRDEKKVLIKEMVTEDQKRLEEKLVEMVEGAFAKSGPVRKALSGALRYIMEAGGEALHSFTGAGSDAIQKYNRHFPKFFPVTQTTHFSIHEAKVENARTSLTAFIQKQLKTDPNLRKAQGILKAYMEAKLIPVNIFGDKGEGAFLMQKATAPEFTAGLLADLSLQKFTEIKMVKWVKRLTQKQNSLKDQADLLVQVRSTDQVSLQDLQREQQRLFRDAVDIRDKILRGLGLAGSILDLRIMDRLNIKEPMQHLKQRRDAALQPVDLALTSMFEGIQKIQKTIQITTSRLAELERVASNPGQPESSRKDAQTQSAQLKQDLINMKQSLADVTASDVRQCVANAVNQSSAFKGDYNIFEQLRMALDQGGSVDDAVDDVVAGFTTRLLSTIQTGQVDPKFQSALDSWNTHVGVNFVTFVLQRGPVLEKGSLEHCIAAMKTPKKQAEVMATLAVKRALDQTLENANNSMGTQAALKDSLLFGSSQEPTLEKILDRFQDILSKAQNLDTKKKEIFNFDTTVSALCARDIKVPGSQASDTSLPFKEQLQLIPDQPSFERLDAYTSKGLELTDQEKVALKKARDLFIKQNQKAEKELSEAVKKAALKLLALDHEYFKFFKFEIRKSLVGKLSLAKVREDLKDNTTMEQVTRKLNEKLENSRPFRKAWEKFVHECLPVLAAKTIAEITKDSDPDVAGAQESYLEHLGKCHREYTQPFIKTALSDFATGLPFSTASELLVVLMVQEVVEKELDKEEAKLKKGDVLPAFMKEPIMQDMITPELKEQCREIQTQTIQQLTSLLGEVNNEAEACLKFQGVLHPLAEAARIVVRNQSLVRNQSQFLRR